MRESSFQFAASVFKRHGLLSVGGRILDVGGTPEVFYELNLPRHLSPWQRFRNALIRRLGGTARIKPNIVSRANPLGELFPKLEYLDRGYNREMLGTNQNFTLDFTKDEQVEHIFDQFRLVISFDTLEHVNAPKAFCQNLVRVAKPGSYIYLQTVFSYSYHPSPEDYYRFSPKGLEECFKGSWAEIIECDWEEYNVAPYILLKRSI